MELKFKKLSAHAVIPTCGTGGSAGLDLYLPEPVFLDAYTAVRKVPLHLAVDVPKGYVGLITERHSISVTGVRVALEVIGSDHGEELSITASNNSPHSKKYDEGVRIARLVIVPYLQCVPVQSEEPGFTVGGAKRCRGNGI